MSRQTLIRRRGRAVALARSTGIALAACALLPSQAALADCNAYPFSVSQPIVERFAMRPSRLLEDFRDGGTDMSRVVSLLAASSRAVFPALMTQARMANPQQRRAIAGGLATATKLCAGTSPATAKLIEDTVRKQTETAFQTDFRAGLVDDRRKQGTDIVSATRALRQNGADSGNLFFTPSSPGSIGQLTPLNSVPQIRRYDLPIR